LVTSTPDRGARRAAVTASQVFAGALAIVAGLIFAVIFKNYLWDRKPPQVPKDDSVEVTVAAANIYQMMEVRPVQVKKIRMPAADADKLKKTGRVLLTGNQPVGRVTKHPIKAETPFYDDDLYELTYPEPVSKYIRPGYRAVIITLPAKEAMVQVGDYVDVYCTLANDALGPGGNGTAEIAKGAKVVARFGTTRIGAQPPGGPDAPRTYTLEVTPYRDALIELAKSVGGRFSFAVAATAAGEGDSVVPPVGNDPATEPAADLVTGDDLALLFGVKPPPDVPGPWVVEKYVGIQNAGSTTWPNYVPPSQPPVGGGNTGSGRPRAQNGVSGASHTSLATATRSSSSSSGQSLGGFKAPNDPDKPKGCATCGKK
jgi:Flp pilus assembly protein CpaB